MFGRLASWILHHRALVSILTAAVVLAIGAGAARTQLDFSFKKLIGGRDPAYAELERFTAAWSGDEKITIVVVSVEEGDLLRPDRLEAMASLTEALDRLEVVELASGPTSFPVNLGAEPGMVDTTPLLETLPGEGASAAEVAAWRERVLGNGGLVPRMLSRDGRYAAILVELAIDPDDLLSFSPALADVRGALDPYRGQAGLTLATAGVAASRADVISLMKSDMTLFSAISALAMVILLVLMFRSVHGLLIPLTTAVLPTVMLFGVMGWAGEPVGIVSQVYPVLIPAIAVADTIHVLSRFLDEARARLAAGAPWDDATRVASIISAMGHVGTACLFTSVTTMIGFLSLYTADMSVLHSFGSYAAVGIALAFLTMIVVAPLLMTLVREVPPPRGLKSGQGLSETTFSWIAATTARHPVAWLAGSALLVAAAGLLASRVVVNNTLADSLPPGHPSNQAADLVDQHLGGVLAMQVDLRGEPGTLLEPASLMAMDRIERWGAAEGAFITVQGPAGVVRALNAAMGGPDAVPDSREVAAELLFMLEGSEALEKILDDDAGRARVILTSPDAGSRAVLPHMEALEAEVAEAVEGAGLTAAVTGVPYVAYRGFAKVAEELVVSLITAFLLIAACIGLLFRSLRICVISLVPNVVPLVFVLGTMGLAGLNLEINSAIIFTVALALAVDNTIHLLTRLYEERRHHADPAAILRGALMNTGRALTISTAILSGAFAINVFSSFPALSIFGRLGTVAIITALLANFFMLPPLMQLFGGLKKPGQVGGM